VEESLPSLPSVPLPSVPPTPEPDPLLAPAVVLDPVDPEALLPSPVLELFVPESEPLVAPSPFFSVCPQAARTRAAASRTFSLSDTDIGWSVARSLVAASFLVA
jgi:hypothetical protein